MALGPEICRIFQGFGTKIHTLHGFWDLKYVECFRALVPKFIPFMGLGTLNISNISGLWYQNPYPSWVLGPETLNIEYLDPLGKSHGHTESPTE